MIDRRAFSFASPRASATKSLPLARAFREESYTLVVRPYGATLSTSIDLCALLERMMLGVGAGIELEPLLLLAPLTPPRAPT